MKAEPMYAHDAACNVIHDGPAACPPPCDHDWHMDGQTSRCPKCQSVGSPAWSEPAAVEEYAQLYASGAMLVRNNHPEIERIFPLEKWIEANTHHGGRVFRRVITVIEDWTEVKR